MTKDDLMRPILIEVCKDGTISYHHKDEDNPVNDGAPLPVFSVHTPAEARMIQEHFGKLNYVPHPDTGDHWYVMPEFSGEVDDLLDEIGPQFKQYYEEQIQ